MTPAAERRPVAIIGLDCAEPELVFDRWRQELPNLDRLCRTGLWGRLESTVPPITVPAWTSMVTGKDPGQLGCYGFRNRKDHSYDGLYLAFANTIDAPRLWDRLGAAGRESIVVAVPQTYPPAPIKGSLVSCFLTPGLDSQFTHPPQLADEVQQTVGEYLFDVSDFRSDDLPRILADTYRMTERRFRLGRHLATTRPWDLFMLVEIGVDRMHHCFWQFMDQEHVLYTPDSPYRDAIKDYYRYIDRQVGELVQRLPPDTLVLVVSDHGAVPMQGGVCLNEWLVQEGYLRLLGYPDAPTPLGRLDVDWPRTTAWGDGGYYGRLFLNVRGREPAGLIAPEDYERVRGELADRLERLPGPDGRPLGTRVFRPERIYRATRNVPPDLIIYFGDLRWRSIGSVGHAAIWTRDNDTGPDGANHSQHGICIIADRAGRPGPAAAAPGSEVQGLSIYDICPTVLAALGLAVPADLPGRVVPWR